MQKIKGSNVNPKTTTAAEAAVVVEHNA